MQFEDSFFNVTLYGDASTGTALRAHQVVLAACSSVLKEILTIHKTFQSNTMPIIYLRNVQHEDLALILDFIYQGEVTVSKDRITSFISLGEDLKVEGLFKLKDLDHAIEPPVP